MSEESDNNGPTVEEQLVANIGFMETVLTDLFRFVDSDDRLQALERYIRDSNLQPLRQAYAAYLTIKARKLMEG